MSDPSPPSTGPGSQAPKYEPPKPAAQQNPAFRMLGLPNLRAKLPSRNWLIFLSLTGSLAAAITYDRHQKKAARKKWCDLVAHVAEQPLPVNQMPRKLTIFLSAQPGDGIRPSREYFKEYIKPILVAAAMDYDVIEGRKEGDVRYGTAEQIRRLRRMKGEQGRNLEQEDDIDREKVIEMARQQLKISPEPAVKGDLVIGRHTWKEYIRGLHEGWLGPLDEPIPLPQESSATASNSPSPPADTNTPSLEASPDDPKPVSQEAETKPDTKTNASSIPSAYISTSDYASSMPSPNLPSQLEPSSPIPHRHILGFFNTPIRIHRFLTQRYLADSIGRETAAIVLGFYRPYHQHDLVNNPLEEDTTANVDTSPVATAPSFPQQQQQQQQQEVKSIFNSKWEQQSLLNNEEFDWHKSVRKPLKIEKDEEGDSTSDNKGEKASNRDAERLWLDEPVMDPRIAERMRRFDLAVEEEERATRIGEGLERGGGRREESEGEGGGGAEGKEKKGIWSWLQW